MNIIGITGKKFSGKDTIANFIKDYFNEINEKYVILHFADFLKECASNVFNINIDTFNDPTLKELNFSNPIYIDDKIEQLNVFLNLKLNEHQLSATNPRQLLQFIGTEYVKEIQPNYWLDVVFKKINSLTDIQGVIIPDVRFIEESKAIIDNKGTVIKVKRSSNVQNDIHTSETQKIPYNMVMQNDGTIEVLKTTVKNMCTFYFIKNKKKVQKFV